MLCLHLSCGSSLTMRINMFTWTTVFLNNPFPWNKKVNEHNIQEISYIIYDHEVVKWHIESWTLEISFMQRKLTCLKYKYHLNNYLNLFNEMYILIQFVLYSSHVFEKLHGDTSQIRGNHSLLYLPLLGHDKCEDWQNIKLVITVGLFSVVSCFMIFSLWEIKDVYNPYTPAALFQANLHDGRTPQPAISPE